MNTIRLEYPIPSTFRYGIVRHSTTGGYGKRWTPSLQNAFDQKVDEVAPYLSGKGVNVPVIAKCWKHIEAIHRNNPKGYEYIRSIGDMWINIAYAIETPYSIAKAEQIVGGGNFVLLDKFTSTHARMVCYSWDFDFSLLDPEVSNWYNYPYLYSKCMMTDIITGQVMRVGSGIDAYFPNMLGYDNALRRTPYKWVNISTEVELFPVLPFTLDNGKIVVKYVLQGASVIGEFEDGSRTWLLKARNGSEREFPTNWKLNTIGVLPPD